MNVIAGLLIGWFNDFWIARILVPFIWGGTWCLYQSIKGADRDYVNGMEMAKRDPPTGSSHRVAFYKIEYLTATSTCLVFSVLAGVVSPFIK